MVVTIQIHGNSIMKALDNIYLYILIFVSIITITIVPIYIYKNEEGIFSIFAFWSIFYASFFGTSNSAVLLNFYTASKVLKKIFILLHLIFIIISLFYINEYSRSNSNLIKGPVILSLALSTSVISILRYQRKL